ncbi:MAG: hypothetical protein ACT4R6_04605 [Gemmatimonadaceae bacterium]
MTRYRDAYRVASFLVGFGDIIKIVGGLAGVLIAIIGFSASSNFGGDAAGFASLLMGVLVGGMFFVFGVMIAAQGQVLRASLDTAVSSSRFMTDTERAQAMGISARVSAISA